MRRVEFEGYPSGDGECFCWDVDEATFRRLTGNEPCESDAAVFTRGAYMLYPRDVFGRSSCRAKMRFRIEFEEAGST